MTVGETPGPRPFEDAAAFRPVRAYATLGLLLALYTLSFLDRTILSLLITPLKQELRLDDFEVSLLVGMAFSLFYAVMGLPIAYLADRYSRRLLIVVGVCLWSVMTALGGIAESYGLLFASRMGVGLGEAALGPAAYSLIADIFPRHKIGRAMGIYTLGVPLGLGLAMILGGEVVRFVAQAGAIELPGFGALSAWRATLLAVGFPGVLLGLCMLLVREPARRVRSGEDRSVPALPFVRARLHIFLPLFLGVSLVTSVTFGTSIWAPTLFLRKFGLSAGEAATPIGLAIGLGGMLGMLVGGTVADRLFARGVGAAYIGVIAAAHLLCWPFFAAAPLMPTPLLASAMLFLAFFFQCWQGGLPLAAIQLITPNHLRARVTALYLLVTSLVGIGCGPTVIGAASQLFGEAHLDRSMALAAAVQLPLAALLVGSTAARFRRTLEAENRL